MSFELHPQLAQDTVYIGYFPLSLVLLSRDANYPWVILVPHERDIQEIYQLTVHDQLQLMRESSVLSKCLAETFQADKMNLAALGNVVPQLHLHHVVRYQTDPAWPGPIWGKVPALAYTESEFQARVQTIHAALELTEFTAADLAYIHL